MNGWMNNFNRFYSDFVTQHSGGITMLEYFKWYNGVNVKRGLDRSNPDENRQGEHIVFD